jgi:ParB/RepB/Spo0J family partition protein
MNQENQYKKIKLSDITGISEHNVRKTRNPEDVEALSESYTTFGVLQPIVVHEVEDGKYVVLFGGSRWLGAKRRNYETIPCIVVPKQAPNDIQLMSLMENIQRQPLNIDERAACMNVLLEYYRDLDILARKLGIRPTVIRQWLNAARATEKVKEKADPHEDTETLAALGELPEDRQTRLWELMEKKRMGRRARIAVIRELKANPWLQEKEVVENILNEGTDTTVSIHIQSDLHRSLREAASTRQMTKPTYVLEALEFYLRKEGYYPPKPRPKPVQEVEQQQPQQ